MSPNATRAIDIKSSVPGAAGLKSQGLLALWLVYSPQTSGFPPGSEVKKVPLLRQ